MKAAVISIALLAAGCAATPEQLAKQSEGDAREFADATKNRTAGKPVDCIDSTRADGPQIIGDDTLVYRDGASRVYVTKVVGACPSLRGDPLIVAEIYGGRLCRNDRFRTVDRGASIPSGYCRFGDFTPYTRKKS